MRWILMASFGSAFALSVVLVLIIRALALRWGFVDRPGGRKRHGRGVPLGGGLALLLAWGLPVLGAAGLSCVWLAHPSILPISGNLADDVARAASRFPTVGALLLGGVAIALLGLWDDRRDLGAVPKLLGQIAVAFGIALVPGVRVTIFIGVTWIEVLVTVVWVVALINCFNMLDNMDGQSGLVAFLTGGALLVLAMQTSQYFIAGMLLALLGGLLGFLLYNLPPASIFMGDAGSMLTGYVLAVSTTLTTFIAPGATNPLFPALVPLVIFAVPLYDMVSVLTIRLERGRPLMVGDRNHFAHRLLRLGMSERMVLVTMGLLVLATAPAATIPYGSSAWQVLVPAVQAVSVICVIGLLEVASSRFPEQQEDA